MNYSWIGLDHIQIAIPVGSEEVAKAFYDDVIGMNEMPKPESLKGRGGCWFHCGQHEIHLGVEDPFTPAKKAHPGIIVKNLEALKSKLQKLNLELFEAEPIEGRSRFHVLDPFGNRLEFLEFHKSIL